MCNYFRNISKNASAQPETVIIQRIIWYEKQKKLLTESKISYKRVIGIY